MGRISVLQNLLANEYTNLIRKKKKKIQVTPLVQLLRERERAFSNPNLVCDFHTYLGNIAHA